MADAAYREHAPPPGLAPWVECLWERSVPIDGDGAVQRVLPDGCIDLIWRDGLGLQAVGANTTAFLARVAPGSSAVGIRFRPGGAPALLGVPGEALLDVRAPAAEVWGPGAGRLEDLVARARLPVERGGLLLDWLGRRAARASAPDPLVAAAAVRLGGDRPDPVAALADRLGVGQRHLRRRFVAEVGYGPKRFARVLRLQRALAIARAGRARGWAEVAYAAGYADQSHLVNDCRDLAGVPPTLLAA
jgi:AraC-like DNA-binding protein